MQSSWAPADGWWHCRSRRLTALRPPISPAVGGLRTLNAWPRLPLIHRAPPAHHLRPGTRESARPTALLAHTIGRPKRAPWKVSTIRLPRGSTSRCRNDPQFALLDAK
jgi:hypothetical protein